MKEVSASAGSPECRSKRSRAISRYTTSHRVPSCPASRGMPIRSAGKLQVLGASAYLFPTAPGRIDGVAARRAAPDRGSSWNELPGTADESPASGRSYQILPPWRAQTRVCPSSRTGHGARTSPGSAVWHDNKTAGSSAKSTSQTSSRPRRSIAPLTRTGSLEFLSHLDFG
jgi:hypothetical protein